MTRVAAVMSCVVVAVAGCPPALDVGGGPANVDQQSAAGQAPATPTPTPLTPTPLTPTPVPSNGSGAVAGRVLYDDKPAVGVQVRLCERFNFIMKSCDGRAFSARTDAEGRYRFVDVVPGTYQGLYAQVFDSPHIQYLKDGLLSAKQLAVGPGVLDVDDVHLEKHDLEISAPKSGTSVDARALELVWPAYPNAAYYKVTLQPQDFHQRSPYTLLRVDDPRFAVRALDPNGAQLLTNGPHRYSVEAYNKNDRKLAESAAGLVVTITGGAAPQ